MEKSPCAKCKTAGGVVICDGCNRSFCSNHFSEHRQELSLEMDNLGQNYDLLRRDLSLETEEHPFVTRINSWEEEAIKRIRTAAAAARADLQKLVGEVKNDLETSVIRVIGEIKNSRDSNDFTETDFQRWNEQLQELRRAFETPSNISLEKSSDNTQTIGLIKISTQISSTCTPLATSQEENHSRFTEKKSFFSMNEKFDSKTEAILSENNLTATCIPKYTSPGAIVYGFNFYSHGAHDISFRVERKGLSRLFFGIFSASKKRIDVVSGYENSVYGWWDMDSTVINGIKQEGKSEHIISTGDKVVLTLDCNKEQIQLYNIRENRQTQIAVDINKCPYPWKVIVKLTAKGDCVRIL